MILELYVDQGYFIDAALQKAAYLSLARYNCMSN